MLDPIFFQMVLSEEVQGLMGAMLQMADRIINIMHKMLPVIGQLQSSLLSIDDLNLVTNNDFRQVCPLWCFSWYMIKSVSTFVTLVNNIPPTRAGILFLSLHFIHLTSLFPPRRREERGAASRAKLHSLPSLEHCAVRGSWLCLESPNFPSSRRRAIPSPTNARGRR